MACVPAQEAPTVDDPSYRDLVLIFIYLGCLLFISYVGCFLLNSIVGLYIDPLYFLWNLMKVCVICYLEDFGVKPFLRVEV